MGVKFHEKSYKYKYSKEKRIIVKANLALFKNRTLTYIVPSLREYGKEFSDYFNKLSWRAFGINDRNFMGNMEDGEAIFCLAKIDNYVIFEEVMGYLRSHHSWVEDYIFSLQDNLHMIVIKNPKPKSIESFLIGAYSKMYSKEDINRFFLKFINFKGIDRYTTVYSVLTKREDYFPIFCEKIKTEFNVSYDTQYNPELEMDFPPLLGEEVFNYDESSPYSEEYMAQKNLLDKVRS